MKKRYYGLDIAKGISVLGMILSHSFMGTAAKWKSSILFSLVAKIPTGLLYTLMIPICLFSQMGSLFSLISAVCVTLSFMEISKKGFRVVWRYILMKMVFGFLLRGIEIFWNQWTVDWDFFEKGKMQWPVVTIPFSSHTLDCIGFIGWFIPLLVYILRLIPYVADYRIQVGILYVFSLGLTLVSRDIASAGRIAEDYCHDNGLFFCAYLFSKVGSGPFQLPQILPFGLTGAAIAILLHSTSSLRPLLVFSLLSAISNGLVGVLLLLRVDDLVSEVFESFKPEGFMLLLLGMQTLLLLLFFLLFDDPARPRARRLAALRRTVFLRRLNALSLSSFVLEPFLSKKVFTLFQLPPLFGPGIDYDKELCLWSWPVVALYSLTVTLVAVLLARLWEAAGFRFSMEYQLSAIMKWLFDIQYDKVNFKKNIYGPVEELQEEINREQHRSDDLVVEY